MNSDANNNGTYQLITPPALKNRVGGGSGIDAELARRASTAVKRMRIEFSRRVATAVDEISEHFKTPEGGGSDSIGEILRISGDLQMQGIAFGYPLVSEICGSLSGYVKTLDVVDELPRKVIHAHTGAIRSVIANAIEGDGGRLGQDLIESLNLLVTKSIR